MKSNAADILTILNSDDVGTFFLVELQFSAPYYYTTHPYDLTWNGNLYRSESNLIGFEAPRASTVVDRQTYKLQLSALDPDMTAEVSNGIIYRPVVIKLGFTVDGVPQLGLSDLMHVYSGTVANVQKSIGDMTQIFAVECSAPLSSLDAKSTLFTTKDAIKQFDSADTSFDQIFEGSAERTLDWGKKAPRRAQKPITWVFGLPT